jgi:DNA-binding IclR family transcriptional regulator
MYVLPALANAARVRLLGLLRERKRAAVAKLVEETGMTRINVQRHLACMERCGLAALDGDEVTWREPTDSLSRLFIKLSLA